MVLFLFHMRLPMYDAVIVVAELLGGSILLALGLWGLFSPNAKPWRKDVSRTWLRSQREYEGRNTFQGVTIKFPIRKHE